MAHTECREIVTNKRKHRLDSEATKGVKPYTFRRFCEFIAVFMYQSHTNRNEIISGIAVFEGVGAKRSPQGFEIALIDGARQGVDLGASVVDVIFPCHGIAGVFQQRRQDITEHCTACMTDMKGAGGVGGDEFYVNLFALPLIKGTITCTRGGNKYQRVVPKCRVEAHVDEPRTGHIDRRNTLPGSQTHCQTLS